MSKLNKEQQAVFDEKLKASLEKAVKANSGKPLTKEVVQDITDDLMAEFDESPSAQRKRLAEEERIKNSVKENMHKKRTDVMMPHDRHNPYEPPKV